MYKFLTHLFLTLLTLTLLFSVLPFTKLFQAFSFASIIAFFVTLNYILFKEAIQFSNTLFNKEVHPYEQRK